jgi:hypothetical protein
VGILTDQASLSADQSGQLDNTNVSVNVQPRPVLGSTINLTAVTGPSFIRSPSNARYRRLVGGRTVPVGTVVDARRARIRLRSVRDRRGRLQAADFFAGSFIVLQPHGIAPVTQLLATGGDFAACPLGFRESQSLRLLTRRSRVRRVWGNGKGRFRTQGRYAAATVRGTVWLTEDRCDGTLIVVRSGVASVYDRVLQRTILVRAGQSYFARAPAFGSG